MYIAHANRPASDPEINILTRTRIGWPRPPSERTKKHPSKLRAPRELSIALNTQWPDDAHFTAYAPRAVGAGDHAVRLTTDALRPEQISQLWPAQSVEMRLLVVDVDAAAAHRSGRTPGQLWRLRERKKLHELRKRAPGFVSFETRGGYRLIWALERPAVLRDMADAEAWKAFYVGALEWIKDTAGIEGDAACKDWTRLYRLPNVVREGAGKQTARVEGELTTGWPLSRTGRPAISTPKLHAVPNHTAKRSKYAGVRVETPKRDAPRCPSDVEPEEHAIAVCEWAPIAIEGDGGHATLLKLASDLVIGLDLDAETACSIAEEHYNPRCEPPWEEGDRDFARKFEEAEKNTLDRPVGYLLTPEPAAHPKGDPFAVLGTNPGLDSARTELDWLCEGLALAPGKVSLLTAYAGRGKTPFACLAGVCVAAGVPLLGHEVRRARVLYLAHEGGRNARRKILRTAQGLGLDARGLERDGWLTVLDARALNPAAVAAIERAATEKEIGFVIVDTVTSALRAGDATRNDEAYARVLFDLGEISARTGCVILGLAHDAKSAVGSDLRGTSGTSAIVEAAQTVIRLEAKESDPTRMKVSCVRAPDLPFAAFGIHWVDGEGTLGQRLGDGVALFCKVDTAAPAVERPTTRTAHNATLRAQKLQHIERTVTRIGETLAAAPGGSCTLQDLHVEAGDASKRVVNESIMLMRSAGVVFRQNGLHRLAGEWIDIDTEDVAGRLGELIATDTNFAHLRD